MEQNREPRSRWHVPAAFALAVTLVTLSLEVREHWDEHEAERTTPSTLTASTTIVPPTTEGLTTSTSTPKTTPEALRPGIDLATGPLIRGSGIMFDKKRAIGVDCAPDAQQVNPSSELRLPLDLGDDSVSHNPFAEIERVVFLGREINRSLVSYTLSDGLAVVLNQGQLELFSFKVKDSGFLTATAEGVFLRTMKPAELQSPNGVTFSTDTLTLTARINLEAPPSEQLELSIRCN